MRPNEVAAPNAASPFCASCEHHWRSTGEFFSLADEMYSLCEILGKRSIPGGSNKGNRLHTMYWETNLSSRREMVSLRRKNLKTFEKVCMGH